MLLSDLLEKYNLSYQKLDQILDDLSRTIDFNETDVIRQLEAAKEREDREDAQNRANAQNFVTRLDPDQVEIIAQFLLEPGEEIGTIAYYFEPDYMVLDLAKYITVKARRRLRVDRYEVYDLFVYRYGELAPVSMQQKYHKLMYNYFGEDYLKKSIED